MGKHLCKSFLQIIPVLLTVSVIVFCLVRLSGSPIDLLLPEEATEEDRAMLASELGLDKPVYVQYAIFLKNAVKGDFGRSHRYNNEPALKLVMERFPVSMQLAFAAIVITIFFGISLGIVSALSRGHPIDLLIRGFSVLGKTVPNFWLGIMMIIIFSVQLRLLPVSGRGSWKNLVMPATALAMNFMARVASLVRANMLDTLGQDYIRTARSKGLSEIVIIFKHALKNSILPVITVLTMDFARLLGGSMIIETIFAWPGMGQFIMKAVTTKDMAVVQAGVMVVAIVMVLSNLLADLLYSLIDPRIKY
jgi:peptide/nickel transport system permease protein